MIELLVAAALSLSQNGQASSAEGATLRTERIVTTRRVEIPRMIYRDIAPYYDCLAKSSGAEFRARGAVSNEGFLEIRQIALRACGKVRARAKSDAVKELRKARMSPDERPATVENVLINVEDNLLTPPTLDETDR
jgi:hypothetical protein